MRSGDDGREDVDGGFSDPEKEMTNWLLALQHCGKRVGEELLKLQDEEGVVSVVLTHTDSKHGQLPLLSYNRKYDSAENWRWRAAHSRTCPRARREDGEKG
jgi:hypothetical protein